MISPLHVRLCLRLHVSLGMHVHVVKMFSFCTSVSFSVTTRDRGLAYTYIWGRQTETREPYLMFTYISWFTAPREKCSVSVLRSVSQ